MSNEQIVPPKKTTPDNPQLALVGFFTSNPSLIAPEVSAPSLVFKSLVGKLEEDQNDQLQKAHMDNFMRNVQKKFD